MNPTPINSAEIGQTTPKAHNVRDFVSGIGGLLLGSVPAGLLVSGLGLTLLISAVNEFTHAHE